MQSISELIQLRSIFIIFSFCNVLTFSLWAQSAPYDNPDPSYELALDHDEFLLFSNLLEEGIRRFGSSLDLKVRLVKEADAIVHHISFSDSGPIQDFEVLMASETQKLLPDHSKIQFDEQTAALRTVKTLTQKLIAARDNPTKIKEHYPQHPIISKGPKNTLQLFVMSQCPYGQHAQKMIIEYLEKAEPKDKVKLDLRYIFYEQQGEGGTTSFTALHGEPEVQENLVQMILRDQFPDFLYPFLKKRVFNESAWEKIAIEIGLSVDQVAHVKSTLENERDALILKEFMYATKAFGVYDGSPTYLWEGRRIQDLKEIGISPGQNLAPGLGCGGQ